MALLDSISAIGRDVDGRCYISVTQKKGLKNMGSMLRCIWFALSVCCSMQDTLQAHIKHLCQYIILMS